MFAVSLNSIYHDQKKRRFQRRTGACPSTIHYPRNGGRPYFLHFTHYRHRILPESVASFPGTAGADHTVRLHLLHRRIGLVPDGRSGVPHNRQPIFHPSGRKPHAYGANEEDPWTIYWIHFKGKLASHFASQCTRPGRDQAGDVLAHQQPHRYV